MIHAIPSHRNGPNGAVAPGPQPPHFRDCHSAHRPSRFVERLQDLAVRVQIVQDVPDPIAREDHHVGHVPGVAQHGHVPARGARDREPNRGHHREIRGGVEHGHLPPRTVDHMNKIALHLRPRHVGVLPRALARPPYMPYDGAAGIQHREPETVVHLHHRDAPVVHRRRERDFIAHAQNRERRHLDRAFVARSKLRR